MILASVSEIAESASSTISEAITGLTTEPLPVTPYTPGEYLDLYITLATDFAAGTLKNVIENIASHPYILPAFVTTTAVSLTVFFYLFPLSSILRHFNWLIDTLWAAPCIVAPEYMDRCYTKKYIKEFEEDSLAKADPSKKTLGIILVMGAQNAGCHLVYWKLLRKLKRRLEKKYDCNVVFEINRWARDGPMDHADKALSPKRFPREQYHHNFIRRIVGDYIGIPIMFLNHELAVESVEASRLRFHKRLADANLYDDSSIVLFAHSLGGPVVYRYLQRYPTTKVDRVISCGSMNHYTNPYAGLKTDVKKNSNPYFPVRCAHLDILDGADFLAFPFYQTNHEDEHLPKADHNHYTRWIEESWLPIVFAHTGYAHCPSFYNAVEAFFA